MIITKIEMKVKIKKLILYNKQVNLVDFHKIQEKN